MPSKIGSSAGSTEQLFAPDRTVRTVRRINNTNTFVRSSVDPAVVKELTHDGRQTRVGYSRTVTD